MNKLYEGGKAVANVMPIRAEDTMPTLKDIDTKILTRFLKLKGKDWAALGSTGKKLPGQTSGDIDIAIDIQKVADNYKIPTEEVGQKILDLLDAAYPKMDKNYMKGLGIVSLAYPIKGSSGNVQVDLMLQDNIDFARWMFHSPDFTKQESEWKGLYRTELLKAIGNAVTVPDMTTYWEDEFDGKYKGKVKKLGRIMLDPNKGYKKQIKSFVGKSGKSVKTGHSEWEEFVSKDPEMITKSLLGVNATIKDTNSFESVWKAMQKKDFPWKANMPEIVTYFVDVIKRKALPLPKELGVKESSNGMKKFSEVHGTINEKKSEIDRATKNSIDKILAELEDELDDGKIEEGVLTTVGTALAIPAVLGMVSKLGTVADKYIKKAMGKEVNPESDYNKWMTKLSTTADDLHHLYLKPIEKIIGKFVKDDSKAKKVANVILHIIIAIFLYSAGATALDAFTSENYELGLLESALAAVKSKEIKSFLVNMIH
jgi:hypothetical protein